MRSLSSLLDLQAEAISIRRFELKNLLYKFTGNRADKFLEVLLNEFSVYFNRNGFAKDGGSNMDLAGINFGDISGSIENTLNTSNPKNKRVISSGELRLELIHFMNKVYSNFFL
jgi:hypothetical protein